LSVSPFHQFLTPVPQQWSFRKIGTLGKLASQAEIGDSLQAPRALLRGQKVSPPGKF